METKQFILDLSKDKVEVLDLYCSKNNISRTDLFRRFVDDRIKGNKQEVIKNAKSITSYVKKYENTPMFKETNYSFFENENKIKKPLEVKEREVLKEIANSLARWGLSDEAVLLLDISHWQRFLEKNPEDQKNFEEYVDWKYTNPDLATY